MKSWRVGDSFTRSRFVGETEIDLFCKLVGDYNPIHSDLDAAKAAGFEGPIAQGMIAGSLFSEILGNELPGPGSVYLEQRFKFLGPIYLGTEVSLTVEVISVRPDQKIVTVRTTCVDSTGKVLIDGEAVLLRKILSNSENVVVTCEP